MLRNKGTVNGLTRVHRMAAYCAGAITLASWFFAGFSDSCAKQDEYVDGTSQCAPPARGTIIAARNGRTRMWSALLAPCAASAWTGCWSLARRTCGKFFLLMQRTLDALF
jgi:hypothetical protein